MGIEPRRTLNPHRALSPISDCLAECASPVLAVALIEFADDILFALGIASRLVSLVLFVNMTMAYLCVPDDRINFTHILSNPSDFYGATPYTYWFAALLIMVLGPGLISVDTLIKRWLDRKYKA
jgi:uncharacterized membrane protein YphA (DoxX/SURF4 family)